VNVGEYRHRLDLVSVLAGARYELAELTGGLTNTNLMVEVIASGSGPDPLPPGRYVARCSNGGEELIGIDRAAEHHNTTIAGDLGVAAPARGFDALRGVLIVDYLVGSTLTGDSFADPAVMARAAESCRRLHAGPAFLGEFDMFRRQRGYLSIVRERGFQLPKGYHDWAEHFERLRRVWEATAMPSVPCNNDLLAANFIDDGERVWLIDYEYSGNGDVCFELGSTVSECEFTPEMTEAWTETYFGRATPALIARVQLGALLAQYGWSLWAFIQATTSPIDYDFYAWGELRLERAATTFASPGLEMLLELAMG
jgi:thiamine kinase-like enzyme